MGDDVSRMSMREVVEGSEWIGTVGSPSTHSSIAIDLKAEVAQSGIVGSFGVFVWPQDGKDLLVLGQITSVELRNVPIESHAIRRIISSRGEASPLTGTQDVRRLELSVAAAYYEESGSLKHGNLTSVPSTGTKIYKLRKEVIEWMSHRLREKPFYLGRIYNMDILLPMTLKHFGLKEEGGLGEAIHIGVFGRTGSGKSVLAKMIIAGYAKHGKMSIVILDPQGEFSRELRKDSSPLRKVLDHLGVKYEVYDIYQIQLMKLETLKVVLKEESPFLREMGVIHPDNQERAAGLIANLINNQKTRAKRERRAANLEEFTESGTGDEERESGEEDQELTIGRMAREWYRYCGNREFFDWLVDELRKNVQSIYTSKEAQGRVRTNLDTSYDTLYRYWKAVCSFFLPSEGKKSLEEILRDLKQGNVIISIDLSAEPPESTAELYNWFSRLKALIMLRVIEAIRAFGSAFYKEGGLLNTLVVIDEAHRYVPRERLEGDDLYETLRSTLIDSVRTTRKYGIGWMFISPSIDSVARDIVDQTRFKFFGFGLSWGRELRALQDIVGGKGSDMFLDIYRGFRDPTAAVILGLRGEYPFMAIGPMSVLAVTGSPIFFTALDYEEEFLEKNFPEVLSSEQ